MVGKIVAPLIFMLILNVSGCIESVATSPCTKPKIIIVRGSGRAISALKPPGEKFVLVTADIKGTLTVPDGKKFILTDILYIAQKNVKENLIVNIADLDKDNGTYGILFQICIGPQQSQQVHLQTGFEISSGHALTAFTGGAVADEQYVSISITGYFIDD